MVTGIVEVTQDPEKAGSSLKVLSLRLRGMKGSLEEMGEEVDDNVENISKMQGQILNMTKGKVNIFDASGNFKSTYEIMKGIAEVWDDLSSIDQANLLETIAGKHRANDVAALLSNWQNVEEAVKSAAKAEGSAARENAKYVDSLKGRLDKLTTAWQSFAETFMSSDFLKGAVSGLTTFVELIEKLVDSTGTLGTLGLGAGIFGIVKNFSTLKSLGKDVFTALTTNAMESIDSFTKWSKASDGVVSSGKALASSMSAVVGGIGLAIAAIGLAVNAYKNYKESISEARQEVIQASDEFLEASNSFDQVYIKYSGKTDLTAEEEAELESAIKGTVDALGDKSSALQDAVNSSNDYVSSLERIADEELKAAKAAADAKKEKSRLELEDTVKGWAKFDGSEVDVNIASGVNPYSDEVAKIAKEVGKDFYTTTGSSGSGTSVTVGFELAADADINEIVDYYHMLTEYQSKLSDADLADTTAYENVTAAIDKMSESMDVYIDGVYDAAKASYQLDKGIPTTTEEYLKMRQAILNSEDIDNKSFDTRKMIANTLDSEYAEVFDLSSVEVQAKKFVGLIKGYGNGTKDGTDEIGTVETFLNMRTAVNNNECTASQYLSELNNVTSMAEKFSDEEREEFNIAFGIDTDAIKEQYDNAYNYISRNYLEKLNTSGMTSFDAKEYKNHETQRIKDILDNLTASELEAVVNLKGEIDWETSNTDEILNQIKKEAAFIEAMHYTISIDVEAEGIEALNTALSESVSGTGLSSESITALKDRYAELASQGYDLSAMFEETSNGIHLNKNAVSEFEQALASQKLTEADGHLEVLKDRYDELTTEIDNCTDAGERASLYSEQQDVVRKINDLATLTSQYKGLTSAYNAWQNAESSGNERDMYESIIEGFETVEDEISRGWYDDGTIKFLELMTGQTDLAGKSASELKEIWNSLDDTIKGTSYSVKDFFTTDEDGNSTSTGAYNFLRAVEELGKNGGLKALKGKNINELVERNSKGKIVSFDFDVVGGDKAIADALGVSEEIVQIIQRTLDDAGFVVTLDGKYSLLADLKTSAEESNNALKKLQTEGLKELKDVDLNFDFEVDTVQGYQEQLEKATTALDKFRDKNGKLKTDKNGNLVKGAKEALEIAEYYTAAMDKLTEPKFMQIDTSTVDDELQDPIEKMQTIGDLCKEKHLVSLTGDTEDLKEVQGEIDKVAKEIEELDPEVKAQIGIDENWDAKTIADKIEKGEIEVPAELKLDVQMSEDLKDMRLMMMKQLGLVDDNEVKLKIGYDIDDSTVDKLIKDGKEKIVLEFITENEELFNTLTEDKKKIVINLVSSGIDLDKLDKDKKKIFIDFVAKNEKWFNELSDEKKEIVVNLVSVGVDLDSLDDDKKKIVVEYVEKNKNIFDNLTDDEKKVVIKYVAEGKDFDKLTKEEQKVIVKLIGDDSELKKWSPEQKEAMVKYIVDGGDVEGWTPEQKQAYAQYLVDHGDIDGWTPEKKQAWAQYLVDGGEVDGWTPEMKDAYVNYVVNGGDVEGWTPDDKKAFAKYVVDGGDPAKYQPPKKDQKVKAKLDSSEPDGYNAPPKDQQITAKLDSSAVDGYNPPPKTMTIWAKIKKKASNLWDKITGGGGVNGTANTSGSSFAYGSIGKAYQHGDWRTKKTETALTGELGREIVVTPQNRWYTVGDNGAEFVNIPRGSIIFNHRQTEELLKNGKVTSDGGRAKALVNGTAFLKGTAFSSGTGGGEEAEVKSIVVGTNKNTGKTYTKSTDSDSAKDFEETFDLIEIAISRVERAIDKLDLKANSVYKSWSTRNNALTKEIGKVGDEITLQEKAANEYLNAANGVGLSSSWQTKVKNGEVDIETVKDEVLAEKIKDFQDYYEKYLDCIDAAEELRETEAKLFAQRFENVQTQYDGILQGYEHTEAMLNEYISQAEENGYVVSKKYYNALINNEKSNIAELKKEQADLIAKRDEAVDSGAIVKNSEEWLNMCASIDEVTQEIESSTTALLEFDNAMRDIDWSVFDLIQERISAVSEEADFLIELMSNDKLFDDNGKLTSQGLATIGLHAQNYNSHMYAADTYGEEVAKLDKQIESDPYDQELINHRNELLELQREAILNAEQEKDAIRDMVEDGINLELDALQELIDKKNKELESEKDLYEYSKKVKEQTEEIASLEKQMASYSGDDSEEAKTKIQELKVSLEEAKTDLQETEYDKYISDTSALLDELYLEYETILNTRLDNIDYLLESVIETINLAASADGNIATALGSEGALALAISNNATSIGTTLTSEAKNVGTTLSSAMNNIWDAGEGNAKSVLTMYGEDFKTKSTTIITTLNSIKSDIAAMVDDVDKDAQKKVTANKTTTSAKKNPTASSGSSSNKNNSTTNKTTSSGDGRPKVGDKVKFVSGKYYYDSEGKKPLGSKYQGKEVYITKINTAKWATHPYHISTGSKLGKGDLGWLKLNQLSGYASGKKNFSDDEIAWTQEGNKREFIVRPSDGAILTPIAKKDSILNANASRNIWDMANSPAEFIKENLNLGGTNIPNNSNVNNNYTQHLNVTQNFPNVKSYEETLLTLSKDPNFKRLLNAMTTEQYIGKSSLRIGKAIR